MPANENYDWRQFAELVVGRRSQASAAGADPGDISDVKLGELIGLAYSASLLQEEGAFIQCQMHVLPASGQFGHGITPIHFRKEIELSSPDVIRKLAPALPLNGHGLWIAEDRDRLVVKGILEARWNRDVINIGGFSLSCAPGLRGNTIAILGPGRISAYGSFPALVFTAGRVVSPFTRFSEYPPAATAFRPIIKRVFSKRVKFTDRILDLSDKSAMIPYYVADTWQRIINLSIKGKHGGAFVIPGPGGLKQINRKYPITGFSLGKRMVRLWEAAFLEELSSQFELQKVLNWRNAYAELENAVASIAAFSQVDGAVIISDRLDVIGFGAKLSPKHDEKSRNLRCVDPWTGLIDRELRQRISALGTRHGSAFSFCRTNPNSIAFVVSQDGDVRIFVSTSTTVTMVPATEYRMRA